MHMKNGRVSDNESMKFWVCARDRERGRRLMTEYLSVDIESKKKI